MFDGARLRRFTAIDLAPNAAFLGGGIVVCGRRAHGERFTRGLLHETWEVRRGGSLVWGDALHLDGEIAAIIDNPACFDGAAGFATLILAPAGENPQKFVGAARAVQTIMTAPGNQRWCNVGRRRSRRPLARRRRDAIAPRLCRSRLPFARRSVGIAAPHAALFGMFDAGRTARWNLTPREKDKLLVAVAAMVAERRLRRGVEAQLSQAVALITDYVLEGARDGRGVAYLMRDGAAVIGREQVMEGVAEMIAEIQVEATFPDGTKLVTVHEPIR